ncbi:hypothetical protein [Xenorhabdus ishibashii]|uniref:hypothetical protein n=1 Tax=Xenorhabdus ishibashii TaxID=1034471 RepID=UPI00114590A8|nr:hypothetical protein [Xenorhabdus ishibashii]
MEKATSVLTDAGSPEARAQREQLKDEFTDELAQNIRKGHFNNESKVEANYSGMSVSQNAMKYGAANYQQNADIFKEYANKGGVIQKVTVIDSDNNKGTKMPLLDSINYGISTDGQAHQAKKRLTRIS